MFYWQGVEVLKTEYAKLKEAKGSLNVEQIREMNEKN